MDPRVESILRKAGLDAARAVVTPLEGGITNRNYRVEVDGRKLALRVSGENSALLGIDRRHEHAAASIAARAGVGPEVVCFLEAEGALLTRFVEGRPLSPAEAARPEMIGRIIDLVRRIHGGPAFPGRFSAFETVRSYHALALAHGVRFPEATPRALAAMDRIEAALGPPERPAPCHNDLLAANFIDDGREVRILDWEYAGMGDPFFDLGNFAANQALSDEGCELVARRYFGRARPRDLARLRLMRLASDLRESFWGFVQVGVSRIEFDYREYASRHLERFLEGAAAPELERWLKEAAR